MVDSKWPYHQIWHDNWIAHDLLLILIQGHFHVDDLHLKVKDMWDANSNWDFSTLSFVLPSHLQDLIHATPKPFHLSLDDLPSWNSSSNGCFNLHSAYLLASNLTHDPNARPWKWLWTIPTIPRVKTFLWLACHDRLLTKGHLFQRHILPKTTCLLCCSSVETTLHVLRDYPTIQPIWHELSKLNIPHNFFNLDLPNWVKFVSTSTSITPLLPLVPWNFSFPFVAWSIWLARNKLVMEGQLFVVQLILKKIKALSLDTFHILPT